MLPFPGDIVEYWSNGVQRSRKSGKVLHIRSFSQREDDPNVLIRWRVDEVRRTIIGFCDHNDATVESRVVGVTVAHVR